MFWQQPRRRDRDLHAPIVMLIPINRNSATRLTIVHTVVLRYQILARYNGDNEVGLFSDNLRRVRAHDMDMTLFRERYVVNLLRITCYVQYRGVNKAMV